jgi:hypothetical protein
LKLKIDKARNVHGNKCYQPLKLSLILPGYEAMYLVRNTIAYFDKPAQELNNAQLDALQHLNTEIQDNINTILAIHPLSAFDKLLPAQTMRQLWSWLNLIFFGRDSSLSRFHWTHNDPYDLSNSNSATALGWARRGLTHQYIEMITWAPAQCIDFAKRLVLDLLSILTCIYGSMRARRA